MDADTAEKKFDLCLVGVFRLFHQIIVVIVEVEENGSCLTRCWTPGYYLLPFSDHTFFKVEHGFWQSWKAQICEGEVKQQHFLEVNVG